MDKSNHDAIKKLAQYYYNIGDYEGLTSISVLDDGIVYLYLGRHNIDIGDKNIAVYYYLKAISKNMTEAMYELGNIYKTGEPFVKYHTLAAKELYIPSMKILAEYYRKIGQINLMIDYYTILSSFGDIDSMNKLSYYYSSIGDYDKMILYLDLVSEQQRQIPHQVAFDSFDKFNYCTYGTDEFSDLDMPKLSKTSILGLETDTTDYGLIGETYDLNEFSEFASHIDHAEITI
jgi:TPR repeat protein